MRVWITRTEPGASRTAQRLAAAGIDGLIDPVLEVRHLPARLDLAGFDALVFTSPNAVGAFAALCDERSNTTFAVGEATAEGLAGIGFSDIRTAEGDVQALARRLGEQAPGRVLHLAPALPTADLAALAAPFGVEVVAVPIYETIPATPTIALNVDGLDAVMVHSARAGAVLAERAASRLKELIVLALSPACAAPFADMGVKSIEVAPFPDDASLVRLAHDTLSKARA